MDPSGVGLPGRYSSCLVLGSLFEQELIVLRPRHSFAGRALKIFARLSESSLFSPLRYKLLRDNGLIQVTHPWERATDDMRSNLLANRSNLLANRSTLIVPRVFPAASGRDLYSRRPPVPARPRGLARRAFLPRRDFCSGFQRLPSGPSGADSGACGS